MDIFFFIYFRKAGASSSQVFTYIGRFGTDCKTAFFLCIRISGSVFLFLSDHHPVIPLFGHASFLGVDSLVCAEGLHARRHWNTHCTNCPSPGDSGGYSLFILSRISTMYASRTIMQSASLPHSDERFTILQFCLSPNLLASQFIFLGLSTKPRELFLCHSSLFTVRSPTHVAVLASHWSFQENTSI